MTVTTASHHTALALGAAAAAAAAMVLAPAHAGAATKLHCTASASPTNPKQYSTVHINVNGNKSGAHLHTVAHYKSTSTAHNATANRYGNAAIAYAISGATKGYKVKVNVSLTAGSGQATCSTAFTPR
jgi:hypothetical protein